ncbi:MAG: hypothetical protein RSA18_02905 [Bacilli bacterium]
MKLLEKELKCKRKAIFFDLEGTQNTSEIIAIGAIKVSLDAKYNVKSVDKKAFRMLVKSIGRVGPIVSRLVHITDQDLAREGVSYLDAMKHFKKFIGKKPEDYIYIAYGNYDKVMLHKTDALYEDKNKDFLITLSKNYLDFSKFLSRFMKNGKSNTYSLLEAINNLGGTPLKNVHDPLCDSRNLLILYECFLKNKNNLKSQYRKSISHDNLAYPIQMIVNKLENGESVTPADYSFYIDEVFK